MLGDKEEVLSNAIHQQALMAVEEADVILFLVDAVDGLGDKEWVPQICNCICQHKFFVSMLPITLLPLDLIFNYFQ